MLNLLPSNSEKSQFRPDWALSEAAQHVLAFDLHRHKPKSILELGPGLSTLMFRRYIHFNGGRLWSIDHESAHKSNDCEVYKLGTDDWYNIDSPDISTYEYILIDGPVKSRSVPRALEFYKLHSTENTIFMIDDTHRIEEQTVVRFLTKVYGHYGVDVIDTHYKDRKTTILYPNVKH